MNEVALRLLYGAAAAEAATWGGMFQRALLLPYWTRRKRREIEDEHDRAGSSEIPVPFALNQPQRLLRAGPGARSEWIAFQLRSVTRSGGRYHRGRALRAWRALAETREAPRLSISQRAALDHLLAGREPPQSGHDHAHYFDDAACVRALALACALHGDDDATIGAVRSDAVITNAEDGVWAAEALAAAAAESMRGGSPEHAVHAARERLPEGAWITDRTDVALELVPGASEPLDLALRLDHDLANAAYSYGDAAPDVLPLAFAILLMVRGIYDQALYAALAMPRHAPSLAPILGALCAAGGSLPAPMAVLRERLPTFLCVALPQLRGASLDEAVTERLHDERD